MKLFKNILGVFFLSILLFTGCQEEDKEFGDLIAPTNITLSYEVLGQDDENPNGDGSGIVNFSATAESIAAKRYI